MQLLVSVRTDAEVATALAGGADVVDAKEPARGSLGAVTPEVLEAIAARVPASVPFSAALGDFTKPEGARLAVYRTPLARRGAPVYLKVGFAGARSPGRVAAIVEAALEAAAGLSSAPVVVPVAYADHERAGTLSSERVLQSALAAGAAAMLIDTYIKDGHGLLDWIGLDRLHRVADAARARGLLVALAGSLDLAAIDRIAALADVIGVRGAACRGGRVGVVDRRLVGLIRERMLAAAAGPLAKREARSSGRRLASSQVHVLKHAKGGTPRA